MEQSDVERAWEELLKYNSHVMEATSVPGVALGVVWLPGKFERAAGFGIRKVGASDLHAVDADTVFPLASLSKPLTSTILAFLTQGRQGSDGQRLQWSADVPGLGWACPVSYAQLLAHRSGLPDHAGDLLEDLGHSREDILQRLGALALNPAGTFAYTNFGFTAAAVRAAAHVGSSWEALTRDFFARLGMSSTNSRFEDFVAHPQRTWGHRLRQPGPIHLPLRGERGPEPWFHDVQRNPDQQAPAGGVSSTAWDMIQWLRLQLGDPSALNKLGLDAACFAAIAETHRPYVGKSGYGLGWNVKQKDGIVVELSHSGAFDMGAATCVMLWPEDKLGIVALTNAAPIGVPEVLCAAFRRLVLDPTQSAATLETQQAPAHLRPDQKLPLLADAVQTMEAMLHLPKKSHDAPEPTQRVAADFRFQGKFASAFYGEVEFKVENGRLLMTLGSERFDLSATAKPNVFVFDSRGEFGASNNRVEFVAGSAGAKDRVTLWNLFASYPQQLAREGEADSVCPLAGVVRSWSVLAQRPARLALTFTRPGVDGILRGESVDVVRGMNFFANANFDVLEGDRIGFVEEAHTYWQVSTDDFTIAFDIDREGTFLRKV
jgi:CubicO group peptidase (beta-lactamase class C family)